jgi:hypothetical protein
MTSAGRPPTDSASAVPAEGVVSLGKARVAETEAHTFLSQSQAYDTFLKDQSVCGDAANGGIVRGIDTLVGFFTLTWSVQPPC